MTSHTVLSVAQILLAFRMKGTFQLFCFDCHSKLEYDLAKEKPLAQPTSLTESVKRSANHLDFSLACRKNTHTLKKIPSLDLQSKIQSTKKNALGFQHPRLNFKSTKRIVKLTFNSSSVHHCSLTLDKRNASRLRQLMKLYQAPVDAVLTGYFDLTSYTLQTLTQKLKFQVFDIICSTIQITSFILENS